MIFNNSTNRTNSKTLNFEHDHSFEINLSNLQATDIMPDNSFVAYFSVVGSDYVLMQNVRELKVMAQPQLQPFLNRPMPQSNVPPVASAHNDPTLPQIKGYIAEPNNTTQVRTQSVLTAKYVYGQLATLYGLLLNLKTLSVNNMGGTMFQNLATQTYVLAETLNNVVVGLTNNPNPIMPQPEFKTQNNYCNLLGMAQKTTHNVIVGLIKLNKLLVIPNINPWLNNGLHTMWVVLSGLNMANQNC